MTHLQQIIVLVHLSVWFTRLHSFHPRITKWCHWGTHQVCEPSKVGYVAMVLRVRPSTAVRVPVPSDISSTSMHRTPVPLDIIFPGSRDRMRDTEYQGLEI
ncbi:hypothetical protein EDD18DRAFT_1215240 [Armillaria luteobubalina]|uniref:Secreted protein n=1 Tax=Armillaria luteobubalina TaxID=153913 RepID=A0AA39P2T6_9AGAR|nr:hypothetical protein EDD18DRAFT_1215240 [Armillaria luteobubalina]